VQAVEANGAVVWLSPNGPIGDWRHDIDRPPLGSLTGMLFRAMVDRLDHHSDDEQDRLVRPSHLYILRSLYPHGASVTQLAERCEVTKQAISQVLNQLEVLNLVRRAAHHQDGRAKLVELTEEGQRALARAVDAWTGVEREWAGLVGFEAVHEVRRAMVTFLEAYGNWHQGDEPRLRPVW
jgi:DNA-binding MarR family transcriptional regulator